MSPRVEILGVFGSGKTTLGRKLVAAPHELLAEQHEANPFWGNRHALKAAGYLPYDLAFLLQHVSLIASAREVHASAALCDWSLASDRLWASMRLGHDMSAYVSTFDVLADRVGPPVGYLYLKQLPEVIAERIVGRGRRVERDLLRDVAKAADYLDRLVAELPAGKVLVVNDEFGREMYQEQLALWL